MNGFDALIERGDDARRRGNLEDAISAYVTAADCVEVVPAAAALKLGRTLFDAGDFESALLWIRRVVDGGDDFRAWYAAAGLLERLRDTKVLEAFLPVRLALLSTHNCSMLAPLLRLVAARERIDLTTYEAPYGHYEQELLDPVAGIRAFGPDLVLLVPHTQDLSLPAYSDDSEAVVASEVARWSAAWGPSIELGARVVQHLFVAPGSSTMGHLGATLPGSDVSVIRRLNLALGEAAAASSIAVVDADAVASTHGKDAWFDDRMWNHAKQSSALGALPLLARHTGAVLAAQLGRSKKCLVLDLDNLLWGGVIGEDGLAGIALGGGADGEAFVALQRQIKRLADRGVVLAVASKNDDAAAREPFLRHPDMVLTLDDIASFQANWDPKPDSLRAVAAELDLGLDSLVFLDDNPAERQAIRRAVPEVDVVALPADPAGYAAALAAYPKFETATFTAEDRDRVRQYRARAEALSLRETASSLADFQASLGMVATVAPVDDVSLPRVVQLLGKTNQFNLTTRRHDAATVQRFVDDRTSIHRTLRLRDRFADHGLVGVIIAVRSDHATYEVDTLALSCRVIGRGAELVLIGAVVDDARRHGATRIRGCHVPTDRNGLVERLYEDLGFIAAGARGEERLWEANLDDVACLRDIAIDVQTLTGAAP